MPSKTKPCEIPLADVLAHLRADPALSPEARELALGRVWCATSGEHERIGLRAPGLPDGG